MVSKVKDMPTYFGCDKHSQWIINGDVWIDGYMIFQCPECGAELEVWADYLIEERPADFDSFRYERRELIRHCDKCHCDWENEWCTENGDVSESQLKRKYWG